MRRLSPQTTAVLNALRAGATYGLEVMHRTGLASSTVYPVLRRMETAGWVRSNLTQTTGTSRGRPPRRVYTLTATAPAVAQQAA